MAQGHGTLQLHAAQWLSPAEALVLADGENQKQLLVSFQEYQKRKMVPSQCAPKASSSFSLSATQMVIISLWSFSSVLP